MARTDGVWEIIEGVVRTIGPNGYDILIYGSNRYLNFNTLTGSSGYGFRDNNGVMEYKNSGGVWTPIFGSSGGTVTGTITLEENAGIQLDSVLSADGKRTGTIITATAGYTQAFGDLVYLDPTDSRREAVDANAAAGADGDARGLIGMVVSAGTDGNACTILLNGTIRADANFPTLTIGGPVYASETAGDVTSTAPTTSAAIVRVIGQALTADSLYFNPSADFIEIA